MSELVDASPAVDYEIDQGGSIGEPERFEGVNRRTVMGVLPFLAYLILVMLFFGYAIAFHFSTTVIGLPGDTGGFVWFLRWWPRALLSGNDPFFSGYIWYPVGQDLVWNTSVPFLSFASYPLSLVLSPIVQYNVVLVFVLALDAWYGYRLLRRMNAKFWVSWSVGWLVPFSSYVVGQSQGHLDLITLFPLFGVVFAIQDLLSEMRRWDYAWARFFLWSTISLYTSIELSIDLGVVFIVAGMYYLNRIRREAILERLAALRAAVVYMAAAVSLVGVLLLVFAVLKRFVSVSFNVPDYYSADLLNYLSPTVVQGMFGNSLTLSARFLGNASENGAFLAAPSFVAIYLYIRGAKRDINKLLFGTVGIVAVILSFGPYLTILGTRILPMPWYLFSDIPVVRDTLPVRLAVFVLPVVLVAWGYVLTQTKRKLFWYVLLLVTLVIQGPYFGGGFWSFTPGIPRLFTTSAYRSTFHSGSVVMFANSWVVNGQSSIAQADTNFYFKMIGFEAASNELLQEPSLLLPQVVNTGIPQEVGTFRSDLNRLGAQFYVVPVSSYIAHKTFYKNFDLRMTDGIYVAKRPSKGW